MEFRKEDMENKARNQKKDPRQKLQKISKSRCEEKAKGEAITG